MRGPIRLFARPEIAAVLVVLANNWFGRRLFGGANNRKPWPTWRYVTSCSGCLSCSLHTQTTGNGGCSGCSGVYVPEQPNNRPRDDADKGRNRPRCRGGGAGRSPPTRPIPLLPTGHRPIPHETYDAALPRDEPTNDRPPNPVETATATDCPCGRWLTADPPRTHDRQARRSRGPQQGHNTSPRKGTANE